MNCILVTGGLGYIGSHVVKKLYNAGYTNIIVIDNLSSGIYKKQNKTIFENVDITDIIQLENVFSKHKIDFVFHIAGKAFVNESFHKIDEYYNTNVIGTINILNMMVKYNVQNIVFSSSCAVYGNCTKMPITEETLLAPISPYGNTKKICEEIIANYCKTQNIKSVILRFFNVAGNDAECIGIDNSNNFKRIIPSIIFKALNNEVVYINGNNYNTIDGTTARTYIHVDELASVNLQCLTYLENTSTKKTVLNVGSSNYYTILEIIKITELLLNKKIQYSFKDKIDGDPDLVFCDNKLLKKILNIEIQSNIENIIKSYINFINKMQ